MDKKYIPSALVLYLNYFIHGIGCSILSQQEVKEMLASQWGLKDVMAVTSIAAALGLGRLISLPFAGPLSDKLGRRLSVIIGCASYVIFLVGIAFSPNTTIAYIAALYGMEVIDSGVAVLSMHAPWEVTSKADIYEAKKAYKAFLLEA